MRSSRHVRLFGFVLAVTGILTCVAALAVFAFSLVDLLPRQPTGEHRPDIGEAIAVWAESAPPGAMVDLTQVAPFQWDRVAVFATYAERQTAERILGFDWNIDDSPTAVREAGQLMGFALDETIVAWTIVPKTAPFHFVHEGDALVADRYEAVFTWTGADFTYDLGAFGGPRLLWSSAP